MTRAISATGHPTAVHISGLFYPNRHRGSLLASSVVTGGTLRCVAAAATAFNSTANGAQATATGAGSVANGANATTIGEVSIANGDNATATGGSSVANGGKFGDPRSRTSLVLDLDFPIASTRAYRALSSAATATAVAISTRPMSVCEVSSEVDAGRRGFLGETAEFFRLFDIFFGADNDHDQLHAERWS